MSTHAQPHVNEAYETAGNPITKEPAEKRAAANNASDNSRVTEMREQNDVSGDANQAPLGRGIRGAPAGEEAKGLSEEEVGRHKELDGEQLATFGEGKIADAVKNEEKTGTGGVEPSLTSDLDRKKEEQKEAREAIKGARAEGKDVGGSLGQSSGPASTVN